MSYRKEHGIYARMFAFWACLLLVAYGCFHEAGLADTLKGWMGGSDAELVASFPLVKTLRVSTCIAAGFLAVMGFVIHAILNRPRVADLLIETENELRKVRDAEAQARRRAAQTLSVLSAHAERLRP